MEFWIPDQRVPKTGPFRVVGDGPQKFLPGLSTTGMFFEANAVSNGPLSVFADFLIV